MKCCELTAGKLRHTVTLSRKVSTPDGFGGFTVAWIDYATVKAFINPLGGSERMQADRLESAINSRAHIRYRDDIRVSDKLIFKGLDYNIKAVINMENRNLWIELDLTQGDAV